MDKMHLKSVSPGVAKLGPEKVEELVDHLQPFFDGLTFHIIGEVPGVELTGVDFHFTVDGEQIILERTIKKGRP